MALTSPGVMTIAQKMDQTQNHSTGFDYIRMGLAIAVVLWHTTVICYGRTVQDAVFNGPFGPFFAVILPMFFALSGFLVCGSLERCRTLISFLSLRVIRIFPALVAEVCLSALLLGPMLTEATMFDYFHAEQFANYFLNMLGIVHFELPGLFLQNPLPGIVNGQLWTVPLELDCYLVLTILSLTLAFRYRIVFYVVVLAFQAILVAQLFQPSLPSNVEMGGRELLLCFLVGVGLYMHRRSVWWHWSLAVAAIVATFALLSIHGGSNLAALPASYLTVFFGLMSPKLPKLLRSGDYSYGIYLYSFPIQQVVAMIPGTHVWYLNALISLPLTFIAAAGSWHLLEKHVLARKKWIYRLEDKALVAWEKLFPRKAPVIDIAAE